MHTFPIMSILFQISILFVTLIFVTESTVEVPSCLMPCSLSTDTPRASLIKQFSSSVDSYTINIDLNGNVGIFKISIFPNATDYIVYSSNITVANWPFNVIYSILDETPAISTVENNGSSLTVQFPSYMLFHVHLQSSAEYVISRLGGDVGSLQRELTATNEEIITLRGEFEEKVQMLNQLKYAISNSTITGDTLLCDSPNPLKYPTADKDCSILAGNWLHIDLKRPFTINYIQFRLWDIDARVHTYSLEISFDKVHWIRLASGKTGQSVQIFELKEPLSIRYIRFEGTNNKSSRKLSLIFLKIDWI